MFVLVRFGCCSLIVCVPWKTFIMPSHAGSSREEVMTGSAEVAFGQPSVSAGVGSLRGQEPPLVDSGESPSSDSRRSDGNRSSASAEMCDRVLLQVITFQGWLVRFSDPLVRRDFLDGKMSVLECSEKLLWSIDRIKEIMLPTPYHPDNVSGDSALLGRNFFARFIAKDDTGEPTDVRGSVLPVSKTYGEWFKYLGLLSSSSYWHILRSSVQSDHWERETRKFLGVDIQGDHEVIDSSTKPKTVLPRRSDAWLNRPRDWRSDEGVGLKRNERGYDMTRRASPSGPLPYADSRYGRAEGFALSVNDKLPSNRGNTNFNEPVSTRDEDRQRSSDLPRRRETTSRRSRDDCSSSESSEDVPRRATSRRVPRGDENYGSMVDMFSRMKFQREVVSPGKFDGKDGTSLKEFLREFEMFFGSKYDGSDKQQARTLGDHLCGAAKRAYDAMGGSTLRYSVLKPELLNWYKGERANVQTKSEGEFRKAKMKADDSFKIYAMRLERLACRAFPDSVSVRERQLCRKFWKTVPDDFRRVLSSSERSLVLHGSAGRLDWVDMVRLAESEDRYRRDRREDVSSDSHTEDEDCFVWYSRPENVVSTGLPKRTNQEKDLGKAGARVSFGSALSEGILKSPRRTAVDSARGSPTRRLTICNWCGRRGHQEDGCWTKIGACMICGSSDHSKDECSRFDRDWSGFEPRCSLCGGPHLGKDCDESLNLQAPSRRS